MLQIIHSFYALLAKTPILATNGLSDNSPFWNLKIAGILLGAILICIYSVMLLRRDDIKPNLQKISRNRKLDIILLIIAFAWTFYHVATAETEFYRWRIHALIALPILAFLLAHYLPDFLGARSLGVIMLLSASPFLKAAFMQTPRSRLILVVVCYIVIIKGLFLACKPYLFRDSLEWMRKSSTGAWNALFTFGICIGVLILACAIFLW